MPEPERIARETIDDLLQKAGWHVCHPTEANVSDHRGVAIREFPLNAGLGEADYLLYVDGQVIEAKRAGFALRGKANLDIFWLKDDSLEDSDNLPEPGVIAAEIVEDLEAALEQFRLIEADLNVDTGP